jgi:hypothetical protein
VARRGCRFLVRLKERRHPGNRYREWYWTSVVSRDSWRIALRGYEEAAVVGTLVEVEQRLAVEVGRRDSILLLW